MQSKFDIGQTVYIVDGVNLISGEVEFIQIDRSGTYLTISDHDRDFLDDYAFADKIDAVTYWLQTNGIEVSTDVEVLKAKVTVALQHV